MEPLFFDGPAAWRAWLEAHHATTPELLVGFWKVGTGRPSLTWPESVDEALCFGWIDGVRRGHGELAYTIRFTPRRASSHWSRVNVDRVAALLAEGRMRPTGIAAFEARREDRTARASYERDEEARLEPHEQAALEADAAAWAWLQAQAPWLRRSSLHWVVSAKRAETRARGLLALIERAREGRPIP
ncbi:MAG TPA: YdeI/OmpD-associated family protein, partial [Myxococcota bacterium]|nr:YdeI/OmpD-associated family protein [Myxococcota bacterium]